MAYEKLNLANGTKFTAEHLAHIEAGIEGAAPAGYGYGGEVLFIGATYAYGEDVLNTKLDEVLATMATNETKLIRFGISAVGNAAIGDWMWKGTLFKSSENYAILTAESSYGNHVSIICKARIEGSWQPFEWESPPMLPGVEYRTTERWDGKPVYKKCVKYTNTEVLSGDTLYKIPHGLSSIDRSYGVKIVARTQGYQIPYMQTNQSTSVSGCGSSDIEFRTTGNTSWSPGRVWYFDMKYVKSE